MIGKNPTTRLGDLLIPSPFPDPDPAGIGQGQNELSLLGGGGQAATGIPVTSIFVDTPTIYVATRIKSIFIQTMNAITWVGAGQALVRLYSGRTQAPAARSGAVSQLNTAGHADEGYVGPAANLGPAAVTALANQGFWLTWADLPALQWALGYVGVELQFPAAPSAGLIAVAIYGQAA